MISGFSHFLVMSRSTKKISLIAAALLGKWPRFLNALGNCIGRLYNLYQYMVYPWKLLDPTIAIIAVLRFGGNFPQASITRCISTSTMMFGFCESICEICVVSSWLSALISDLVHLHCALFLPSLTSRDRCWQAICNSLFISGFQFVSAHDLLDRNRQGMSRAGQTLWVYLWILHSRIGERGKFDYKRRKRHCLWTCKAECRMI